MTVAAPGSGVSLRVLRGIPGKAANRPPAPCLCIYKVTLGISAKEVH